LDIHFGAELTGQSANNGISLVDSYILSKTEFTDRSIIKIHSEENCEKIIFAAGRKLKPLLNDIEVR